MNMTDEWLSFFEFKFTEYIQYRSTFSTYNHLLSYLHAVELLHASASG